jgi:hypothetical protein
MLKHNLERPVIPAQAVIQRLARKPCESSTIPGAKPALVRDVLDSRLRGNDEVRESYEARASRAAPTKKRDRQNRSRLHAFIWQDD